MKVLTIQQPYASLCLNTDKEGKAHKRIETRSWATKYRGELLIHASVGKNYKKIPAHDHFWNGYHNIFAFENMPPIEELPFGAIIGKVTLVDVYPVADLLSGGIGTSKGESWKLFEPDSYEFAFGDYSEGRFGWLLSEPELFDTPIPAKGQLGLWNFDLDKYKVENAIKKAKAKGLVKIVRHYDGFIILAQSEHDYKSKVISIQRGDTKGFYTVERLNSM